MGMPLFWTANPSSIVSLYAFYHTMQGRSAEHHHGADHAVLTLAQQGQAPQNRPDFSIGAQERKGRHLPFHSSFARCHGAAEALPVRIAMLGRDYKIQRFAHGL